MEEEILLKGLMVVITFFLVIVGVLVGIYQTTDEPLLKQALRELPGPVILGSILIFVWGLMFLGPFD